MNNDNRFYARLSIEAFENTICPQAVLDQFPIVKVEGDEETEPVYYTELEDQLTIETACGLAGIPVALFSEMEGQKPTQVFDKAEATNVLLVLPPLLPSALMPFFAVGSLDGGHCRRRTFVCGR